MREDMKSFLLILVLLTMCFSPPSYSQDVNWRWLHILDARHMSAGEDAAHSSLVNEAWTCESSGRPALPSSPRSHPGQVVLSACKLYSHALAHPGQVVLSACKLYSPRSSRARPPGSSALTATSFAQNTERLSCKQHLDSQWH